MGVSWPADSRTRALAEELYRSVAARPLVSVRNGLPARYLAEDLPFIDPLSLVVSHDQGIQGLLRAHGVRAEFSPVEGWLTEASRQAFALVWDHLAAAQTQPWMAVGGDQITFVTGLPPFHTTERGEDVYDALAARMRAEPVYPRRLLPGADLARFATSDDPADDLQSHSILAEDPTWAGRVVPTFSPDRYLEPDRPGWRTDAELLAEITGIDTEDLNGFLAALRHRRTFFLAHGATMSEHHVSDVGVARLPDREAAQLYRLARSAELLPAEALALQRHLLWESGAMSAEDGLVMALYPPAGFRAANRPAAGDAGVTDRIRPLLTDFGPRSGFRVWLFSIDVDSYIEEIVPVAAAEQPALTAVPPTRFADDPDRLRAARAAAVRSVGAAGSLGLVDDMSGPFVLARRHDLARRLDAGALAELVVTGELSETDAYAELSAALDRSILEPPVGPAV